MAHSVSGPRSQAVSLGNAGKTRSPPSFRPSVQVQSFTLARWRQPPGVGPKGLECGSWSPRPSPGGELCFSGLRGGLTHAWGPGAAPARGLARTWVSISISFVPRVGHLMVCPFQTHTLSPFKDRNRTGSPACRAMCVVGLSRLLSPSRPILVGTFSVDTPASVTPWNPGVLAVPHSSGAWTGVVL